MNQADFDVFSTILKKRSGLFLAIEKSYLLQSRLLPVARKWNLASVEELANAIRTKNEERLIVAICEAMTTNESSFFRDQKPFDLFRTVMLPQLMQARAARKHIRIWSAASSSGQEAYSLAIICAEEAAKLKGWRIEIVGTDYSTEMVKRAQAGTYTQFEVQRGLPAPVLIKYFTQLGSDQWQINAALRDTVRFQQANLLEDFTALGSFDIVFCRNVLIYFDRNDKIKVLHNIHSRMAPDGYLLLGGAETVVGLTEKFKAMEKHHSLYLPKAQTAAQAGVA